MRGALGFGAAAGLESFLSEYNLVAANGSLGKLLSQYQPGSEEHTATKLANIKNQPNSENERHNRLKKMVIAQRIISTYQLNLQQRIQRQDVGNGTFRYTLDGKVVEDTSREGIGIAKLYRAAINLGYVQRGKQPQEVGLEVLYRRALEANAMGAMKP